MAEIYSITNPAYPELAYIGSTTLGAKNRFSRHLSNFKRYMAGKYGYCSAFDVLKLRIGQKESTARISILETCHPDLMKIREQKYIDIYRRIPGAKCVNRYRAYVEPVSPMPIMCDSDCDSGDDGIDTDEDPGYDTEDGYYGFCDPVDRNGDAVNEEEINVITQDDDEEESDELVIEIDFHKKKRRLKVRTNKPVPLILNLYDYDSDENDADGCDDGSNESN